MKFIITLFATANLFHAKSTMQQTKYGSISVEIENYSYHSEVKEQRTVPVASQPTDGDVIVKILMQR